ncbi:hypothetical protein HYV81_03810 [Candidatus Woesearchaeota archaeon]|nr:hypothetical protein [Candidatus Woesearchaeota archaeon]
MIGKKGEVPEQAGNWPGAMAMVIALTLILFFILAYVIVNTMIKKWP